MIFYAFLLVLYLWFQALFGYHAIVNKLEVYVESNQTFALQLNKTFGEAGTPNVTYDDMYSFFDYFVTQAPNATSNHLSDVLTQYTRYTPTGSTIFLSRVGQQWFQSYMNAIKRFCDSSNSTYVIPQWEAIPGLNMTEYIIPANGFQSFNDFFARHIKPEYRPIDSINNDSIITSPCDGKIVEIKYNLTANNNYTIKGFNYSLSMMLKNDYYVQQFIGGTIIQILLVENNYHRYHCSVSGYAAQIDQIGGIQFWYSTPPLYTDDYYKWPANNNRRGILYIDTGKFGIVAHNYIGFWLVNSVNIHIDAGIHINKGDETGFFKYGGSSIVLLFQKNALNDIVVQKNDSIQLGQRIAIANMNFYKLQDKKLNKNEL